jgi:nucleotide-binding universal stress UspA family protein
MSNDGRPVIVAGVGELDGRDPALAAAAGVAQAAGAELHLVHAYQVPRTMGVADGFAVALREGSDEYHDQALGALQVVAARVPGARGAACHVLEGSPGASVLQVAERLGADLVVVGATRRSRLGRVFLGSTAQRVLRESGVPVLVARGNLPLPPRRILLACDLTGPGATALATGVGMVEAFAGRPGAVRALYVLPWSLLPPIPTTAPAVDGARGRLEAFLAEHPAPAYPVESTVRCGQPADEIVAEARDWAADLVIVGTHARGRGARLLLGSVAEGTLRDAPCGVLAVPPVRAAARATALAAEAQDVADLAAWVETAAAP